MLKTLIKKQLLELFHPYVIDRKTGKARKKSGMILYIFFGILLFAGLGFAFYSMSGGLGVVILNQGINWLYFALLGLLSLALGVFGSVFNTYASLYLPKDNEFLFSLPIPTRTLLLSRTVGVYIISLMYSAWIWIPGVIAYWVLVPLRAANILAPILLTFVLALLVTFLSLVLGWVVALIAAKAKGKSFLTLALSLLVMVLYYVVYFKIIGSLNDILENLTVIGDSIRSRLGFIYLMGNAADGDLLSLLLFTLIVAALMALAMAVLSRSFRRLSFAETKTVQKAQKGDAYRALEAPRALLRREYRHFISVSTWMLNGGFGLLMLVVIAIAALIKCADIRALLVELSAELPELCAALPVFLMVSVCMIVSTNAITPVSVSMEGNTLWILQSLPIAPWDILHAKEKMSVQLNLWPALFAGLVLALVFRLQITELLVALCAIWFYVWFASDFGLFLNLLRPNLNWTNVAVVTKQSLSVLFNLLGGWFFCLLLGFGGFYLCRALGAFGALCVYAALFGLLWGLMHLWLKKKGVARLLAL